MERIFSFHRFRLLFIRHGHEHLKIYALAWGVISLVILFVIVDSGSQENTLTGLYPLMLCLSGAIMASTIFSPWANFGKASFYLLLPATSTEKFLTGLTYCLFLFIPVFTVLYFGTGMLFNKILHPANELKNFYSGLSGISSFRLFFHIFMAFLLIQSITLVGTIVFKRFQLLISILILVTLFLLFTVSTYFLMKVFTGMEVSTYLNPFFNYGFGIENGKSQVKGTNYFHFTSVINNVNYVVWTLVSILVYFSAWLKLREREL